MDKLLYLWVTHCNPSGLCLDMQVLQCKHCLYFGFCTAEHRTYCWCLKRKWLIFPLFIGLEIPIDTIRFPQLVSASAQAHNCSLKTLLSWQKSIWQKALATEPPNPLEFSLEWGTPLQQWSTKLFSTSKWDTLHYVTDPVLNLKIAITNETYTSK